MKPATSNLASRWSLPRPIIKSYAEEKWAWPWLMAAPKIVGFPFNISATALATDLKFGVQLGFVKGHHKIKPRGTVGVALS